MLTQEDRVKLLGFRVRHDINQLHFSRGIISRNQLSNIENGKSSTTEKVLYQIYLRFCEYMIALDDYNRFDFDSLKNYGPYKQLQEVLDLYDQVCEEVLSIEQINQINLMLNRGHFGLVNAFILERVGDIFLAKNEAETAFLFYLKAYYRMTSSQADEINSPYLIKFLTKVATLGLELNKTLNVIEILDHIDYLKQTVEGVDGNQDYLLLLAESYKQLGLHEKTVEICKRIELINFNEEDMSKSAVGKTFQLMGNLYYEMGSKELSKKYFDKAMKILSEHGTQSQITSLESDIKIKLA